jgi:Glycosyl transferase family 2
MASGGIAVEVAVWVTGIGATFSGVLSVHAIFNAILVRRARTDAPGTEEFVSVLIPARNEALRIGPTIDSLLACDGVDFEVIVLDDGSSDSTAEAVMIAAKGDQRVCVVQSAPLPAQGWLGKPNACRQLGELGRGSVFAFVDADVVVHPSALRASVALLRDHELGLVSPYPRQLAVTAAERLVQPLLQWLWLTFLPLRLAERPRPESMAAANGQLLIVDAVAYRSIGGHTSVAAEVIEDVAMARAMKRAGYRAIVAEGSKIATCRMYTGWPELRDGYSKSLWAAVQPGWASRLVGGLVAFVYVVPTLSFLVGLLFGEGRLVALGAAALAAGYVGRAVSALTTGGRLLDAVWHPVSIVILLGLGRRSHKLHQTGRLTWKGRTVG